MQCTPDLDGMEVDQENLKPATKKVFLEWQQPGLAIQAIAWHSLSKTLATCHQSISTPAGWQQEGCAAAQQLSKHLRACH